MAKGKGGDKKEKVVKEKVAQVEDKRPVMLQELEGNRWSEGVECLERSCRKAKRGPEYERQNPRIRIRRKGSR